MSTWLSEERAALVSVICLLHLRRSQPAVRSEASSRRKTVNKTVHCPGSFKLVNLNSINSLLPAMPRRLVEYLLTGASTGFRYRRAPEPDREETSDSDESPSRHQAAISIPDEPSPMPTQLGKTPWIDSTSYPHIIDFVVRCSSDAVTSSFRMVSLHWRRRVDQLRSRGFGISSGHGGGLQVPRAVYRQIESLSKLGASFVDAPSYRASVGEEEWRLFTQEGEGEHILQLCQSKPCKR